MSYDVEPVVTKVGLAADDGDFFDPKLRHLIDKIETLLGVEFVGSFSSRTRSTMSARKIACERDLPHGVVGTPFLVDVARFIKHGKLLPFGGSGRRSNREQFRPWTEWR